MRYRKKPVVIDAEQWFANSRKVIDGVCTKADTGIMLFIGGSGQPHIHTLEGIYEVSEGDWIITGVKGEKYPCKPDIFEQTYEPVA